MQGMNTSSCDGLKGVTSSAIVPAPSPTGHGLFGRAFDA